MQQERTKNLVIQNPSTPSEFLLRDSLLSTSLRDHPLTWDYKNEYPLVLTESSLKTSWCLFQDQHLAAHASLWPRTLINRSGHHSIKIGLIGNVATHPDHRGCGLMSALFQHLISEAREQDLEALILWSDLLEFYQKRGFSSIGRELRFLIAPTAIQHLTTITRAEVSDLSVSDLEVMLGLRPKLDWIIERSPDEFKPLLGIPNTAIFIRRKGPKIISWIAIGKGSDLQGVIHEWGAVSPQDLMNDIQTILLTWDLPQLTLLMPASISAPWFNHFKLHSESFTEHPMALALPVGHHGEAIKPALARSFFWGFDSI